MRIKYWSLLMMLLVLISCNDSDDDDLGNWVHESDYEGATRSGAVAFTIGDYAYVGLGETSKEYKLDFYRYDASRNYWEAMADFPGVGRISAVAFSINGKGYVGTGYNEDQEQEELSDFWEYDPTANSWTQIADFPTGGRYSAVSFALNNEGYVGTGFDGDNYLKDFYKYNATSMAWESVVSLYGSKREGAIAFVIGDNAYVTSGRNNGSYLYDFFSYDAEADSWTDLTLYDDDDTYDIYIEAISRYNAVAFSVNDLGYIATGIADSYTSTIYSYDPAKNEWDDGITSFEGSSRGLAVSFVLNNTAYVATGRNSSQRFDDIYSFDPTAEYDEYD